MGKQRPEHSQDPAECTEEDVVSPGVQRAGSDGRLCCLVMLGARLEGTKELVAVEDGYHESEESWAALLRDLKKRGMRAPELAVGDGALGFWSALRDVFPETRHQRDWVHKTTNVLDSMPMRACIRGRRGSWLRTTVPAPRWFPPGRQET